MKKDKMHYPDVFVYLKVLWFPAPQTRHVSVLLSRHSGVLFWTCLGVRVRGCGGLASGWWMPVGVFMVYFWPQQQKACWCSKSVTPIVSVTLLLNRFALCPWHTGKHCAALPTLPSWSGSCWAHALTASQENGQGSISLSTIWPTQIFLSDSVFLKIRSHLCLQQNCFIWICDIFLSRILCLIWPDANLSGGF